jgi:hypothetical protein
MTSEGPSGRAFVIRHFFELHSTEPSQAIQHLEFDMKPPYLGGGSDAYSAPYMRSMIARARPRAIVDFGAGRGRMGELCREVLDGPIHLTAVEANPPAIATLRRNQVYDRIDHCLIRDWLAARRERFDLAIFGDVLEHLTRREAFAAARRALELARDVIVHIPLRNLTQDALAENALEEHKAYFTEQCWDRRFVLREKHLLTPDPGWVSMAAWIVGRKHVAWKRRAKDKILLHFGRRGKHFLEALGYDAYAPAGFQWDGPA